MNPLTAAAWCAAFFLSAVLFSHTVALRLLLLILGLGLAAAAIIKNRSSIRVLPPIWLPFALWAVWAALSITWALEPERSAKELRNEIVYAAAAFWMCFLAAQARDAARIILPVLAAGALAVCAVALYWFPKGPGPYSVGWHGGAGNHSSALITLMPCVVMAGWYASRCRWHWTRQWPIWALAGILLVAAYTTLNRTIWLAFAAQFILLGALLVRRRTLIVLALAVIAGAATVMMRVQAEREAIWGPGPLVLEKDSRLALWPEILERIEERPLTGYGFGRGALRASLRAELGGRELWHSHNLLLESVIQLGFPGLLLLLFLLAATLREGWRLTRGRDDVAVACGIALIAVVAGMLLRNMTDVLWVRQNALLYWGVIGVLLAWGSNAHPGRATR